MAEQDTVVFDSAGLVTAVVQDAGTREVLMVAHMNREALAKTLSTGQGWYWSRRRGRLWRKGEESGHTQHVREVKVDCDGDALLVLVDQVGPACHTGHRSCFYRGRAGARGGAPQGLRGPRGSVARPGDPPGAGGRAAPAPPGAARRVLLGPPVCRGPRPPQREGHGGSGGGDPGRPQGDGGAARPGDGGPVVPHPRAPRVPGGRSVGGVR